MRIALVDNMNNNFFALARYFRALGIDADLFLIPDSSLSHFAPDKDTWLNLANSSWIKWFPVSYNWRSYLKPVSKSVRSAFSQYDKVIACGPAVGLLYRAGIGVDLFVPYGSDLFNSPFLSKANLPSNIFRIPISYLISLRRAYLQRKGIQGATYIISNANWKIAQDAIDLLGCSTTSLPRVMVFKEELPSNAFSRFLFFHQHDFVVFSPTRHLWKTNAEPLPDFEVHGGAKRNDKLIRAFSRIVKDRVFENPILVFCDYGSDVLHSKALIQELEIESYVRWLPLMSRRELIAGISMASFVADQFREGMSATSSGTTNEALAYGTPVITNTDGAILDEDDPYYGCPILQALSEEDIYVHLRSYPQNPQVFKDLREMSVKWFDNNLGIGLAYEYLRLLDIPVPVSLQGKALNIAHQ
jgi:glycosyltransferase involved in cell wall biosynthesis